MCDIKPYNCDDGDDDNGAGGAGGAGDDDGLSDDNVYYDVNDDDGTGATNDEVIMRNIKPNIFHDPLIACMFIYVCVCLRKCHTEHDRLVLLTTRPLCVTPGGGVRFSVFSGSLAKNMTPPGGQ
jgi:hypothetical protein